MSCDLDVEMKRVFGVFYGQLIGDALGCRYEFKNSTIVCNKMAKDRQPDGFLPILGGGPFGLRPGQITDDSELALSLARSLVANKKYDKFDVACSYAFWTQSDPPDMAKILTSTWRTDLNLDQKRQIYEKIHQNISLYCKTSLSNGCLMRISPLAIAYRKDLDKLKEFAMEDAGLTHLDKVVFDAVRVYTHAIALLINGVDKNEVFEEAQKTAETNVIQGHLEDAKTKAIPVRLPKEPVEFTDGDASFVGYLGVALQSAFYELLHATSFASGVEAAIARGGDTDTNGCIVATLLGARFGVDDIPEAWIKSVRNAVPRSESLDFVSVKDVDSFVPQLANILND
uniref:ADP-ribosylhydrolase ARH3 n=1 Tax=Acrobeloides nanus TaxID=290746 RepID=A0A914C8F4_9BILA